MSDLSKVPFLAGLEVSDLQALAQRMERRTYDAGDLIYAEGTPGEGLFYVQSGAVVIMTSAGCDGEVMAHLPEGSTFGESALLHDHPRVNAARAASDAVIMFLSRSTFQAFLAERPAAGQAVTQALNQRPVRGPRQLMAELLKPIPTFAALPDDALLQIARKLRLSQFCAGSFIYSEGQHPDALYIVENGTVALVTGEALGRVPVMEVGRRDFFGEDALLTEQPREVGALAKTAVDLWALQRADFDALITTHPAAALSLTRALAARSELFNRQLLAVSANLRGARRVAPVVQPVAVQPTVVPTVARQPLFAGLASWVSGLPTAGKVRLALIAFLLGWLMLVSLPSVVASSLSGSASAPVLSVRGVAMQQSYRGGAVVRGLESDMFAPVGTVDVADAPLARLADVVTVKQSEPALVAAPAVVAAPTSAPLAAVAAPVAPKKEEPVTYTVAPGDTLSQIAAMFDVDVLVLAEANDIEDPALIRVDQVLVIPGGEEQRQLAAKLAAQPRPTPTPRPAPVAVAAAPAPAAPKPAEPAGLPFVWDGRLDKHNIRVEQAAVAPGQQYFRLVKALFRDTNEPVGPNLPGGDHNIYIEVLDENGKRLLGTKVLVRNGGTATLLIENKPFPEYGCNFPMYGMLGSYTAWVDGLPSDKVIGMGLPMKWHVSYFLTFQRTTK